MTMMSVLILLLLKCDKRKTLSNRLLNLDDVFLRPLILTVSKIVRVPKAAEIELQQKPCERDDSAQTERERERGCEDCGRAKQIASRLMPDSQGRHGPKIASWEF